MQVGTMQNTGWRIDGHLRKYFNIRIENALEMYHFQWTKQSKIYDLSMSNGILLSVLVSNVLPQKKLLTLYV